MWICVNMFLKVWKERQANYWQSLCLRRRSDWPRRKLSYLTLSPEKVVRLWVILKNNNVDIIKIRIALLKKIFSLILNTNLGYVLKLASAFSNFHSADILQLCQLCAKHSGRCQPGSDMEVYLRWQHISPGKTLMPSVIIYEESGQCSWCTISAH